MRQIRIGRRIGIGIGIASVACAAALCVPAAIAHRTAAAADQPLTSNTDIAAGYQIYNRYFCAACHTLKAGGPMAYGQLGVNQNKVVSPYPVIVAAVTEGLPAALPLYPTQMVGFKNVLTSQQIQQVASFVFKFQGKPRQTCDFCTSESP
ncbi:MAG TPA: cytochrome c [Gaiellaceae bacterium]|nr:cytochrome c [Gaiellaceae bacterium]